MSDTFVRIASHADLPILLTFEQGIIEAERPMDETLKPGSINYYDIGKLIDAEQAEVFVAIAGNEIIGSAYADIRDAKSYLRHDRYAYLGFMFVKPKFRGQGVNKLIIDEMLIWIKSRGVKEVRLDVYDVNAAAIRAYEKAGFTKDMVNMRLGI